MSSSGSVKNNVRYLENPQRGTEIEREGDNDNINSTEEILNNTWSLKYYMSKSLYWYVRKSLEDMLNDFMLIGKGERGHNKNVGGADMTERNEIIIQMLELPLEFDSNSRRLSVQVLLDAIKSNIDYPDGCVALIAGFNRRKCYISQTLKGDFLHLMEGIICREDISSLYSDLMEPLKEFLRAKDKTTDKEVHKVMKRKILDGPVVKKCRRYTKILIELYRRKVVNATQVLVYMDKLSKKEPDYVFADLLFMMLQEVGLDIEDRLGGCGSSSRGSGYRSFGLGSNDDGIPCSTFDNIFKRLDGFINCVTCNKSIRAIQKVISERKRRKAMKAISTERLPHPVYRGRNGAMSNYTLQRSLYQPTTQSESSAEETVTSSKS